MQIRKILQIYHLLTRIQIINHSRKRQILHNVFFDKSFTLLSTKHKYNFYFYKINSIFANCKTTYYNIRKRFKPYDGLAFFKPANILFFLIGVNFFDFFQKKSIFHPFLTKITLQNHPIRVFCFHFSALLLETGEGGVPHILAPAEITDVQSHGSRVKLAFHLQLIHLRVKIPFFQSTEFQQ